MRAESAFGAGRSQLCDDIASQVELPMTGPARSEELIVDRRVRQEPGAKGFVDFVARLGNAGPDHGGYSIGARAERLHRFDRSLDDPGDRPLPTGMSRADHACGAVGDVQRHIRRGQPGDESAAA